MNGIPVGRYHAQFSNSSRVSFCLASMDTRDCRLLIAAGSEQDVRGVAGRSSSWSGRGGGSVVVRLLVAWPPSQEQSPSMVHPDCLGSLRLTLGSTPQPEPNQPAPRLFGGCDSDASLLVHHHHHSTAVLCDNELSCYRAVPRKPQSSFEKHD